jgi:hypothetical protein
MPTFAEKVIAFNKSLSLDLELPDGIRVMNPFTENPQALEVSSAFYRKFYNDQRQRRLILGINPGRFGAGVTGVPFTDTKRLVEKCGLEIEGLSTHEPSSVFVYDVIDAYGGVEAFYADFYINSPSPLGYVKVNERAREVNYNYYDSKELQGLLEPFMVEAIRAHIANGIITDVAFCLGTGKNYQYLQQLNDRHGFFGRLVPLEHPRYIMQYKLRDKDLYVAKYIGALRAAASKSQG